VSFRTRLLIVFVLTVVVSVGLVAWTVSATTRQAFEQLDAQRTEALVAQFRREFARRGEEVSRRVAGMADAEATLRMAIDLSRATPDYSLYVNDARGLSQAQQLDFVEIVAHDGTIVSSAHWPARFGYKNEWVASLGFDDKQAFLRREELQDGVALAIMAVRVVGVGDRKVFVIGGQRLDKEFLASLVLPAGMRALLYRNLDAKFTPQALTDVSGPLAQAEKLQPLIDRVREQPRETAETIRWSGDAASAETFHAIPLTGRKDDLLGVLLVGSSLRETVAVQSFIRAVALAVGGAGIGLGLFFSWWAAARVTRPIEELAAGARQVAAGNWQARVDVRSSDEVGELAQAFNQMTAQLAAQREQLVQAERVAAWRELARRLAHELKNPLFPLQITVENLQRARERSPEQFEEVFRESTATLLAELENLRAIVGRFSDFARMPAPQLQPVDVNATVRETVRLFEAQFSAAGGPPVAPEPYLTENLGTVQADPELLRRMLQNLILNAMDAMPAGGTLTIRTLRQDGGVRLTVSDTGTGLTPEECQRLFTPYYTTKHHGTGLGLAIVQSVVSDHGGRITVESDPGRGTTFIIDLPAVPPQGPPRTPAEPEPETAGDQESSVTSREVS
jgi:two-component system nitrogen regulation sensor histidine kinase NtrY